ncbi:MAG: hypothetical protein IMW89_01000 [Ktedonobacteraceae bacterium]|nr:hypothetical protein [Ktedonobacteraceae bacterium]
MVQLVFHIIKGFAQALFLGLVGLGMLLGAYTLLRAVRLSVDMITRIVGIVLIAGSVAFCVLALVQSQFAGQLFLIAKLSGALGAVAFLVSVYSVNQWTMRRWYVYAKRQAFSSLAEKSRRFMLFLRQHHFFFGWVVLLTAIAHAMYYVPSLIQHPMYLLQRPAIFTGTIGLLVLIVLAGLGLWVNSAIKHKRLPGSTRMVHFATALVFLGVFVLHLISR